MVETSTQSIEGTGDEINPILSGVLSLLIPGVGHFYHGQKERAVKAFGVFVLAIIARTVVAMVVPSIAFIFAFVVPAVNLAAGYDGYTQAEKINAGEVQI